jgi:hypothetical protein
MARPFSRVLRAAVNTDWVGKAKGVAESLKTEFHAGQAGDNAPVAPIWPAPTQQLEAMMSLFRSAPSEAAPPSDETLDHDAAKVAEALRGVDWADVRSTTAERTGEVARSMRTMADQVDWSKVQPVAANVSSALIAAVASGRIPVGGALGPIVAKAITDQNHLGRRVARNLQQNPATAPPDFRGVIEATAAE